MNTNEHIDEMAELYALGALNERERESVDVHVRTCRECAARLGDAERFIADGIAEREPPAALDRRVHALFAQRRPWTPRLGALVAAAFIIGLLPGAIFGIVHRGPSALDADRQQAIPAMVNSHFLHAQFTPLAHGAPKAKVIYGRGAPWRFFIAQTNRAYVVRTQSGKTLGALHVQDGSAELFVPQNTDRSFELLDGSRPVARVMLR